MTDLAVLSFLFETSGADDFVTGGVVFLQDAFELFSAAAMKGIKGIELELELGLAEAIGFVGIKIEGLDNNIRKLKNDMGELEARLQSGFKNTDQFEEERRRRENYRAITVDEGNAVPIDPVTGRPLTKKGVVSSAYARLGFEEDKKSSGGGGGKGAAEKAMREAEAIADAQLALERSKAEQIVKLLKAEREERLEITEELYARGVVSTRQFYDTKLEIVSKNIEADNS